MHSIRPSSAPRLVRRAARPRIFGPLAAVGLLLAAVALRGEFPEVVNSQPAGEEPPSPAESAAAIRLPEGFRAALFAGEPDVRQPIALEIDDGGRLWVAECYSYQERGWSDEFRDRIVILADTDGDGTHDTRKVFWEEGRHLSGLTLGFGGAWILQYGTLSFLPDRDGDDRPDGPPEVLLDGFDHGRVGHNIVSGLLWGPDGWLYGRHGIQATSLVGPPGASPRERTPLNCSIWRYHPQRGTFEVVTHGTTNPWGLDYDDHGQFFFTNNVIGHLWHVVPGAHYARMYGVDFDPHLYELIEQTADHFHWDAGPNTKWTTSRDGKGEHGRLGGGHSHCGGMIYLGDNWPDRYRGAMFMCNTHGRRVNCDRLVRAGTGYVGRHDDDFLLAGQPWFRGVELKYGPDGGVFLSDWSDLGECHDHDGVHRTSGRIYKITWGDARPDAAVPLPLDRLATKKLVALQLHPNDWYVRRARRLLQERYVAGADLSQARARLWSIFAGNADVTRRLRAVWALHVTGGLAPARLIEVLDDPHEQVRVWAIRLLLDDLEAPRDAPPDLGPDGPTVAALVRRARDDASGLVRTFLASALQRLPDEGAWPLADALARRRGDAEDRTWSLLYWYGIERLVAADPEATIGLLRKSRDWRVTRHAARRLTEEIERDPQAVARLVRFVAQCNPRQRRVALLTGMTEALRGWRKAAPPEGWMAAQQRLLARDEEEVTRLVRELAVVFGDGRALDELRAIVADGNRSPHERRAAIGVLAASRAEALPPLLMKLVDNREVGEAAIRALALYDRPEAARQLVDRFGRLRHGAREATIDLLAARPASAALLLDAVEAGRIDVRLVSAVHARQMLGFEDGALIERLNRVWGPVRPTPVEKRAAIGAHKTRLAALRPEDADLPRGRHVYTRVCGNCHRLYGAGGRIGPDITGGNRDNLDYLLENILDPSAVVPAQFRMSSLRLTDGRVLTGVVLEENPRTLTLQTPKEKIVLPRAEIDAVRLSELSLMPDGLLQNLSDDEIRDLFAYLATRRQVPLPGE